MAEQHPTYTEAIAEIERLLATPRTAPSTDPPDGRLSERLFPSIGVKALRAQFGTPDVILAIAITVIADAKARKGFVAEPDISQVLDLIALHRWWERVELWQPKTVKIDRPTQIVTGKHVQFVRQPSKQPPKLLDIRWWTGERR